MNSSGGTDPWSLGSCTVMKVLIFGVSDNKKNNNTKTMILWF